MTANGTLRKMRSARRREPNASQRKKRMSPSAIGRTSESRALASV